MKTFFRVAQMTVFGAIIAAALFVFGAVVPIDGFYDMRVVMSGSMEPEIQVGSVVAYAERDTYKEGDIIVFTGSSSSAPVTHRIVGIETEDEKVVYVTQGDANEEPDNRRVHISEVLGAVFVSIPYAGYLVASLSTPLGFSILIGLPVLLLVASALRDIVKSDRAK